MQHIQNADESDKNIIIIPKTGDAIKIHKQENEVYTSSKIHEVISSEFKVKDILKNFKEIIKFVRFKSFIKHTCELQRLG